MESKSNVQLQEHMLWTYWGLRVGLVVIGFSLPLIVLFAGGILHHVWLEPSISQYYHTESRLPFLTTRDLFVGGLMAAGACLYLYKGYSDKENIALNVAGVFAVLVAILPTAGTGNARTLTSVLHGTSAVLFFCCIAYVSIRRSRDTINLLPEEKQPIYSRRYFWTSLALIVSPLVAVALSFTLDPTRRTRTIVFWSEALAVWSFSAYWLVKTCEMKESKAEKRTLDAELKREVVPAALTQVAYLKKRPRIFPQAPESAERVVPANESSIPAP